MKTISNTGLSLIKRFEGCSLVAYDDLQPHVSLTPSTKLKGTLTIGWGHTGGVYIGQTITQEEADSWLIRDLATYIAHVNNPTYVNITESLTQNQFDALVSFCYNCGPGNLKKLCAKRTKYEISENILKYNKASGRELLGLTNRRKAEKKLFDTDLLNKPLEEYKMTDNIGQIVTQLNERLVEINVKQNEKITALENRLKDIPAPQWILEEFPDADSSLSQKTGTYDFWRTYLLILKHSKYGK